MKYFQLLDEACSHDRWVVGEICSARKIDASKLTSGRRMLRTRKLVAAVYKSGIPLDYSHNIDDVPILTARAATAIQHLASTEVQMLPVSIDGQHEVFYAMNVCQLIDCVNEVRSKGLLKWTTDDHRDDRIGQYRQITELRIKTESVHGARVFRVRGWDVAIVVNAAIRAVFREQALTGGTFLMV